MRRLYLALSLFAAASAFAQQDFTAWERWGAGFIKTDDWIATLYGELTEK